MILAQEVHESAMGDDDDDNIVVVVVVVVIAVIVVFEPRVTSKTEMRVPTIWDDAVYTEKLILNSMFVQLLCVVFVTMSPQWLHPSNYLTN